MLIRSRTVSRRILSLASASKLSECRPLRAPACAQARLPLLGGVRPFFDAAGSFSRGQPPPPDHMNLILLSGFLGAGKTTVLEQLLRNQHGYKLGVIVNDLASVNVDANVLRDAIDKSGSEAVSLENGCVCCTASEDLRLSVDQLLKAAGPKELDAIVVELSGVAEPARAKQILESPAMPGQADLSRPVSARTVTVVDTPAFAADFVAEQTEHKHHAHTASGECDERYGTLLAEQLESADLILFNKADVATDAELTQTRAMVAALNQTAETRVTEHGNIDVASFLAAEPKDRALLAAEAKEEGKKDKGSAAPSSCCVKKTCSSTNKDSVTACASKETPEKKPSLAETRFGITSFVYSTEKMMSRRKLMMMLGKWQQGRAALGSKLILEGLGQEETTSTVKPSSSKSAAKSPLTPILRSKGVLLLDINPYVAYYWSHAGKSVAFSMFGPWPENTSQDQGGFGAPRTELVFIGVGYEEDAIRKTLDACLLDEEELAQHTAAQSQWHRW